MSLQPRWERELVVLDRDVAEGEFQRSLALIAGVSGLLTGLEVGLEHRQGSYGSRIMYTPVALSAAVFAAGVAGAVKPRLARTWLPLASWVLIADGVVGFGFHIRGIHRKPGGWGQLVTNVAMGPPLFAPLLLGIGGFLGVIASLLRPEGSQPRLPAPVATWPEETLGKVGEEMAAAVRTGRFQKALCVATSVSSVLNGLEALYSHYRSRFYMRAQWVPILIAPALAVTGAAAVVSPKVARTWLPALSGVATVAGTVGSAYHVRGLMRRPGGWRQAFYNLTYGPPTFAPLLFAASGFLGLLASRLRR